MSDSILQVNQIKDKGGNATGITVADSTGNVTVGNLTATTAAINGGSIGSSVTVPAATGSSFVLVKSVQNFGVNTNNDTSNGYISDCFNSSYRDYMVIITGQVGTNEAHLYCRFGLNDTLNTTTAYLWHLRGHDSLSSDNKYNLQGHATNYFALMNGANSDGSNSFDRFTVKLLIHNPQNEYNSSWSGHVGYPRGGTAYISGYTAGIFNGNARFTDMSFYFHGNSQGGTFNFQSYGIKTS